MVPKFLQLDNQKIAYYESPGPSTSLRKGPAVVMIHRFSGRCFQKQLESPLGKKYRFLTLDLPGHGMSDKAAEPEKTYTLPGYAEIVVSFVQQLGLQRAVFVGWSLGGHIILEAADRLRALGLMIFGTPPVSSLVQFQEACFPHPALSRIFNRELSEEEISAWVEACFRPGATDIPGFMITDLKQADGVSRKNLGASVINGDFKDEIDVVSNLNVPLAVIHGEMEQLINFAYLKRLDIPTLWRGEIQVIQDAGHTPQWEQPERFNELLEEFIGEVYVEM